MHNINTIYKISFASIYLLFTLAGCTSISTTGDYEQLDIDGIACIGNMNTPPEGLTESNDKELLQQAKGANGKGELCTGKVFLTEQPIIVFRAWNSNKSYSQYGQWWSFDQTQWI